MLSEKTRLLIHRTNLDAVDTCNEAMRELNIRLEKVGLCNGEVTYRRLNVQFAYYREIAHRLLAECRELI